MENHEIPETKPVSVNRLKICLEYFKIRIQDFKACPDGYSLVAMGLAMACAELIGLLLIYNPDIVNPLAGTCIIVSILFGVYFGLTVLFYRISFYLKTCFKHKPKVIALKEDSFLGF